MKLIRAFAFLFLLVVVSWLLLIAVVVGFVEGSLWLAALVGAQHDLGMNTQTTHNYASVSGVLPMIIAVLGFSSLGVAAYRHLNCHTEGCPHIGRHRMAGGKYLLCTSCLKKDPDHPDVLSAEQIHDAHREHLAG